MQAILQSVQAGKIRSYEDSNGKKWKSAIDKIPITGAVKVQKNGLVADKQADLKHHGGIDKAVLGYSCDHFARWQDEFPDWSVVAGCFGENLTIAGQAESDVYIGDVFQIGSCQLQISQPRQPCWKLARKHEIDKLAVRVQQLGWTGWYFRVLQSGTIQAGDAIELIQRIDNNVSVQRANEIMYAKPRNAADDLTLAKCPQLSTAWREDLQKRSLGKS